MSDAVFRAAERAAFASQAPSDIAIYWALALRAKQLPKHTLEIISDRGPSFGIWTLFPTDYEQAGPAGLQPPRVLDWQRFYRAIGRGPRETLFDLMLPGESFASEGSNNIDQVLVWLGQLGSPSRDRTR